MNPENSNFEVLNPALIETNIAGQIIYQRSTSNRAAVLSPHLQYYQSILGNEAFEHLAF